MRSDGFRDVSMGIGDAGLPTVGLALQECQKFDVSRTKSKVSEARNDRYKSPGCINIKPLIPEVQMQTGAQGTAIVFSCIK